jgi:acyl-CoA hydrolase
MRDDARVNRPVPTTFRDLDAAIDFLLARIDGSLRVGAPLGLGKPHRLLNGLYARIAGDPSRPLHLYTALSLDPPRVHGDDLEARFLRPFSTRHFGDDFPRLAYVHAMKHGTLPAHVEVEEFYFQSGAMLHAPQAQRRYASLNYTHAARALADRGMNVLVQKVAREPDGTRLSLSCNTDLTFDAVDAVQARGLPRPLLIAEVDPELPWIDGTAAVDASYFDAVIDLPGPHPKLFGLPRYPVSDADYAIGFRASTLVRDGGTLQIGIGTLADALCHALALRHLDNVRYRRVLAALDENAEDPALGPFAIGLYGCSEMLNEGFRRLVESGVVRRKVVDDEPLMRRLADGSASDADHARLDRDGQFLHGAFYLGSPAFYAWLRGMDDATRKAIDMRRVSEVNELYGGREALERLQRRDARFFNSCMMATTLGAAVSDGLDDGQVVSGVGGQYNFVAMAHALPDARSALMLRATREAGGEVRSNIIDAYAHTTIPRHLRDVYICEYGIADVRGKVDEDCIIAMAGIADARFQRGLLDTARKHGKLRVDFTAPKEWARNTPVHLQDALAPLHRDGSLPDYPLGSDFTEVEQRLAKALGWLKQGTSTPGGMLRTLASAIASRPPRDEEALTRMELGQPRTIIERIYARLLARALGQVAR